MDSARQPSSAHGTNNHSYIHFHLFCYLFPYCHRSQLLRDPGQKSSCHTCRNGMEPVRVPSIITDKLRPHAKETLYKVKKFVEEKCMPRASHCFSARSDNMLQVSRQMKSSRLNWLSTQIKDGSQCPLYLRISRSRLESWACGTYGCTRTSKKGPASQTSSIHLCARLWDAV
jgi:hypothetical protein